eukprot:c19616_g2_i1 orf=1-189(-)
MATTKPLMLNSSTLCLLILVLITCRAVTAADPDPLQDFCVTLPPEQQQQQQNIFLNGLLCKNP